MTIPEIKEHPWLTDSETATYEEICEEMEKRMALIKISKSSDSVPVHNENILS